MAGAGTAGTSGDVAWRRVLVLGGIRSGKSAFAENLLAGRDAVRYVATARRGGGDAEWEARIEAHRARRPDHWRTVEVGDTPGALAAALADAPDNESVLVDDVGGWVGTVTEVTAPPAWPDLLWALRSAVAVCPARLVLVSPEVGLSVVPPTAAGRAFADSLGTVNQAIASVCDVVVLLIAGNAVPVKGSL
jgi:adenosyl cobinamide kinase/adenosyl cobinamide phosphate guanylyltransferase